MKIKPVDGIVFLIAVVLVLAAFFFAYGDSGDAGLVSIRTSDTEWVYPLESDRTVAVKGPIGETIVRIEGNSAHIVDSPCRDKICVSMGHMRNTGDWAACLPNGVMVRIAGPNHGEVDAVAY